MKSRHWGRQLVVHGFLTCLPERERLLYRFIRMGYQHGAQVTSWLADDTVSTLRKAAFSAGHEAHLLTGFLRFSEQNGTLAAIRSIASFAALIAVNLAVMNLLPIPALDGGHILFLILDTLAAKLFRRRIPAKYENAISSVFLVALMGFMLFVTAHDIFKLIR